jgi:hypothetical protein
MILGDKPLISDMVLSQLPETCKSCKGVLCDLSSETNFFFFTQALAV